DCSCDAAPCRRAAVTKLAPKTVTTMAVETRDFLLVCFFIFNLLFFCNAYARVESITASACLPRTWLTSVIPSRPRNCSGGTFIGPGPEAAPGCGCGNAVEHAV